MVVKENAKLVEELVVIEEQAKGSEERLGGCKREEKNSVEGVGGFIGEGKGSGERMGDCRGAGNGCGAVVQEVEVVQVTYKYTCAYDRKG